jgi:hypothetical protein
MPKDPDRLYVIVVFLLWLAVFLALAVTIAAIMCPAG